MSSVTEEKADLRLQMEFSEKQQTVAPQTEEPASKAMVVFSVLFYIVAAIVMVMVNKAVLNAIQIPLFFLFCQLAIAVILLQVSAVLGYFTLPMLRWETAKTISPLITINCTGLIFNTYCLQLVDASFYQVARGLVLPFTVFFSYFLLSARCSRVTLVSVFVVCAGFFWGVSGESLHSSKTGIMLGIFSSLTTSVHAIVIKKSLSAVSGSTLDLVYYNNALSALVVAPLVFLSGESPVVIDMFLAGGEHLRTFVVGTAVTGIFGFLICVAGFLSIKVTSPVSHMISAAVRGVIQTFLGMSLFGDIITSDRLLGISFILGGSILYTWSKARETSNVALPPTPSVNSPSKREDLLPLSIDTRDSNTTAVNGLTANWRHNASPDPLASPIQRERSPSPGPGSPISSPGGVGGLLIVDKEKSKAY